MTKGCEPGRSAVSRVGLVVRRKDSSDDVFFQVQPESQVDLLGDAWTAETRITPLHFYDRFDDLTGRSFLAPVCVHDLVNIAADTYAFLERCEKEAGWMV